MNVAIDLGNTFAKVGIFDHHQLREKLIMSDVAEVVAYLQNFSGASVIISSVNTDATDVVAKLPQLKQVIVLSSKTPVPIVNRYATPETLGVDRLAAVCGATDMFPGKNCLVIDAGTCLTYELIDSSGVYWGGAISPGLSMRFRAMNSFTARLPRVEPVENPTLPGTSTESCMQSGVIYGIIDEVEGAIRRYSEKFSDLHIILTGGDSRFFENNLKASIFAGPELVLRGLNSILLYNVSD